MSSYILIVHLLFKELRRALFGKLLMFYNTFMVCRGIGALAIQLMHYLIVVNSQAICHTTTIIFALAFSGSEMFATDILYHSAYIMYRCYHLKSKISKKRSEYLFRRYTGYAGFTLILLFFVTIAYDWRNGIGKYTILENGHCSFVDTSSCNTLFLLLLLSPSTINDVFSLSFLPIQVQPQCSCCTGHSTIQSSTFQDCHHYGSRCWSIVFHLHPCCVYSRIF